MKNMFSALKKAVFITAVLLLTSCQSETGNSIQYKTITSDEAKKMIDTKEELVILDVRTEEEYSAGHIKDSVLIPDYELVIAAPEKLPDKNTKILLYCRSGRRSAIAAKTLAELGYTNVYDFGGIINWSYDIER